MTFKDYVANFFISVLLFIFSFMFLMFLCRLFFTLEAGFMDGAIGSSWETKDIVKSLFNGARYDGRIVSFLSLFYGLLSLLLLKSKKRLLFLTIFASVTGFVVILLYVCNMIYFDIYGDTFNAIILGLIYDDRQAIWQTGISGNYNIFLHIMYVIVLNVSFSFVFYKSLKKISNIKLSKPLYVIFVALFGSYIVALLMASTFNLKGGSIDYLITPAKNHFLKKASPGALRDIYVVYLNYKDLSSGSFEKFSKGLDLRGAISLYFNRKIDDKYKDLFPLIRKHVQHGNSEKYKHIFLIVGESLSEWHFDKKFQEIGLASGLLELSSSPNGKKMPVFIQSAEGTIGTIDVLFTGLYNFDAPISSMVGALDSFLSSISSFKKLGYKNLFYYFGSPTWRKLDRYAISQGFDKLYSISDMESAERGVWGVYDSEGFDFVLDETLKHKDEYTFNMILTTSYHPPYDVPLEKYNVPIDEIKTFFNNNYPKNTHHKDMNPSVMAHAWYMNKSITDFVKEITEKLPNSLIIITGDHFDRIHPSQVRDLKTENSIPLIFYGKNISDTVLTAYAGSHIDIVPTILELTAPKGFEYYSFGAPLLSYDKSIQPSLERTALGYDVISSGRYMATDKGRLQYFDSYQKKDEDEEAINKALLRKNMGRALSWHIFYNGYQIEE